jgi:Flp pilus assembly protein TadG
MYLPTFKSLLRGRFARSENGAGHIEAVIMIPAMFVVIITSMTLLDLMRQHNMHTKAAFTIGDMVSRETLPIDADYLTGAHNLLNTMTRTPQDSTVRLSVVRYDSTDKKMKLDWSKTAGPSQQLTDAVVSDWADRLPNMVHNERMIIVETFARYNPPFEVGLGIPEIENFVFTRPRYAPQVLWTDASDPQFAGSS